MGIFDRLLGKRNNEIEKPQAVPELGIDAFSNPQHADVKISCINCNGYYKIREGKYGVFAGCSNYPSCKSTLNLPYLTLRY